MKDYDRLRKFNAVAVADAAHKRLEPSDAVERTKSTLEKPDNV